MTPAKGEPAELRRGAIAPCDKAPDQKDIQVGTAALVSVDTAVFVHGILVVPTAQI